MVHKFSSTIIRSLVTSDAQCKDFLKTNVLKADIITLHTLLSNNFTNLSYLFIVLYVIHV